MASITRTSFAGPALAERIDAFRARWSSRQQRRTAYDRAMMELSVLSDRDLNDLGLSRGDIGHVAREVDRY